MDHTSFLFVFFPRFCCYLRSCKYSLPFKKSEKQCTYIYGADAEDVSIRTRVDQKLY